MSVETLAKKIMAECEKDGEPVTLEDAMEMAKMEIKANGMKNYTKSEDKPKAKVPKERKVDEVKKSLFEIITSALKGTVENGSLKNEVEYSFDYKGENYTLKLTKHRKGK